MKKVQLKDLVKPYQKQFRGGKIPTFDVKLSQNMPRELTPTTNAYQKIMVKIGIKILFQKN